MVGLVAGTAPAIKRMQSAAQLLYFHFLQICSVIFVTINFIFFSLSFSLSI